MNILTIRVRACVRVLLIYCVRYEFGTAAFDTTIRTLEIERKRERSLATSEANIDAVPASHRKTFTEV
jgi:hypothetical protein